MLSAKQRHGADDERYAEFDPEIAKVQQRHAVACPVFAEAAYRWAHLTVEAQEKATTTTDGLKAIKKREGRRRREVKTP